MQNRIIEAATVYSLVNLNLPLPTLRSGEDEPLIFNFLANSETGPRVMTGHDSGVIAISLGEADDDVNKKQSGRATGLFIGAGFFCVTYLFSPMDAVAQQPGRGAALLQIPLPVPRPSFASPTPSDLSTRPDLAPPPSALPTPSADEDDASIHCLANLKLLGAEFMPTASERLDSRCPVAAPVDIKSIKTPAGRVTFPGNPTFHCAFALQFTNWLSNVAAPLVRVLAGSDLAIVETGSGYECRTRKGDASAQAKTSEHATGNAVDIMALGLTDKRQIAISVVADQNNPDHRLLMALRLTACGYFTTVLGPGANAAHANHYHLDLGVHGTSGNYRICE